MKGIYTIFLYLTEKKSIIIGKLGLHLFESGYYAYTGSALSGEHRVNRHIDNAYKGNIKNPHWHIDYLIIHCRIVKWLFAEIVVEGKEEEVATLLSEKMRYIPGFGCSDTSAPSHLFFSKTLYTLEREVKRAYRIAGLKFRLHKGGENVDF